MPKWIVQATVRLAVDVEIELEAENEDHAAEIAMKDDGELLYQVAYDEMCVRSEVVEIDDIRPVTKAG